ncbi:hypothetical protein BDZ89DRAFT_1022153 [Hymenopellis radicata]|nr:hypothetical protein BDZ89DRAFT_1022153 [Hymenopellis radicata]
MSSESAPRSLFFVYAPDKTDEGALERRLSVRSKHLEAAKAAFASGVVRVAGAIIDKGPPPPDGSKKMIGSTFIFEAKSIDEVQKIIESDIYYTSGVWDPEKLVINPFVGGTPIP